MSISGTKKALAVGGAALLTLLAASCDSGGGNSVSNGSQSSSGSSGGSASSGSTAKPVSGGSLSIGQDAAPLNGLDPDNSNSFSATNIIFQVYDGLLGRSTSGAIVPAIAKSYKEVSPTQYDFTIRSNVKFHDGSALTVNDVIYSINRLRTQSQSTRYVYYTDIKSVEAVGDDGVSITLSKPDPAFLNYLSNPNTGAIMSQAWTSGKSASGMATAENGTGPFMISSYKQNAIVLVRSPYYWGPKPPLDKVTFQITPDETSRLAALRSGAIQLAWFREANVAQQAKTDGFTVEADPSTRTMYMLVNTVSGGPLANEKVRQAISEGINRQELISLGTNGTGQLSGAIPPGDATGKQFDAAKLPFYTYNPTDAKALLKSAGYSNVTVTLSLASDPSFAIDVPMAEAMKQELAKIGVTLKLNFTPFAQILQQYTAGTLQGISLIPGTAYPDPGQYLAVYIGAAKSADDQVADPTLTSMLAKAGAEDNVAARTADYDQIDTYIAQHVYLLIPYAMPQRYEAWSKSLVGYQPDIFSERIGLKAAGFSK